MTNFSLTVTDVLYLATLSLGASLNLCFFLDQFLECRVRRAVSLLITTLVTALAVLLYPYIPALVRSFPLLCSLCFWLCSFIRAHSFGVWKSSPYIRSACFFWTFFSWPL